MNPWARAATETFEEVMGTSESESTFFRESNEGFFDIVDRLSAEQASQKLTGKSSIVAHTRHALAYIEGDLVAINGGEQDTDWDETWSVQEMNDDDWAALRKTLREKCVDWTRLINANPTWESPDWMRGTIGAVAHAAYHLGAIRQLAADTLSS